MVAAVSRRRVLVAGAGLLLAGCGGGAHRRRGPLTEANGADAAVLDGLLQQEYQLLAAYGLSQPHLLASDHLLFQGIVAQERRHIAGLEVRIGQLGGTPSRAPANAGLVRPSSRAAALALVSRMEERVIALYIDSLPKISDTPTRVAAAGALADEAEHLSLLAVERGLPAVPAALVTGRP